MLALNQVWHFSLGLPVFLSYFPLLTCFCIYVENPIKKIAWSSGVECLPCMHDVLGYFPVLKKKSQSQWAVLWLYCGQWPPS